MQIARTIGFCLLCYLVCCSAEAQTKVQSKALTQSNKSPSCTFFKEAVLTNQAAGSTTDFKCSGMPPNGSFVAVYYGRVQPNNMVTGTLPNGQKTWSSWVDLRLTTVPPGPNPPPDIGQDPSTSEHIDEDVLQPHLLLLIGQNVPPNGVVVVRLTVEHCQTTSNNTQCSTVQPDKVYLTVVAVAP